MAVDQLQSVESRMADDLDWAATAAEVQRHVGKLVIVYNQKVLAVGTDRDKAIAEASQKVTCPKEHLVVEVVSTHSLEEIPH